MKTSPTMRRAIEEIAAKHNLDFTKAGTGIALYQEGWQRLAIENIGAGNLSVAHYYEQNGDLVADPDVLFYMGTEGWIPYTFQNSIVYREYGQQSRDGVRIVDHPRQEDLAEFTEMWGRNLIDQQWATAGQTQVVPA